MGAVHEQVPEVVAIRRHHVLGFGCLVVNPGGKRGCPFGSWLGSLSFAVLALGVNTVETVKPEIRRLMTKAASLELPIRHRNEQRLQRDP